MKAIGLVLILILLSGCVQQKPCPPKDAVIFIGPGIPVLIPKGHFDNPDNWCTEGQLKKAIEEKEKKQKEDSI